MHYSAPRDRSEMSARFATAASNAVLLLCVLIAGYGGWLIIAINGEQGVIEQEATLANRLTALEDFFHELRWAMRSGAPVSAPQWAVAESTYAATSRASGLW